MAFAKIFDTKQGQALLTKEISDDEYKIIWAAQSQNVIVRLEVTMQNKDDWDNYFNEAKKEFAEFFIKTYTN